MGTTGSFFVETPLTYKEFNFDNSPQAFYGITGEDHYDFTFTGTNAEFLHDDLHNVGIIEYDKDCVDYYKRMMLFFSYTEESVWYYYSSGSSSTGGYGGVDGEACYAYGTNVVRRTSEGKDETVPIEDVKEGDQILGKGTQGLSFTEAIVVDLHPSSNSEALTLKTKSGQQITLTREHMTIVHD